MLKNIECISELFREPGYMHLAYNILKFIDIQTLKTVLFHETTTQQSFIQHPKKESLNQKPLSGTYMNRLVFTYYFIHEYLNKTDRSLYYSFYDEQQFLEIQKQLVRNIVINEAQQQSKQNSFYLYPKQCQILFKKIENEIELSQGQNEEIKRIFCDPSLPLPKMKRENQGIYCGSCFQLFLVSLRFSHGQEEQTLFQQLKQKISQLEEVFLKRFLEVQKEKHQDPILYQNLHFVRYTPYQINFQNYKQLTLKNHSLHNIIVYLFTLTQTFIDAIANYITLIDDPLYKFVQIMSRYSAFRSFVMEMEQNFGFLFQTYDTLYSDTIRDSVSNKPKYCFWRPAMAKWYVKMNKIHSQANDIYFMLLTYMRKNNLLGLFEKYPVLKKYEICIKNSLEENNFLEKIKEKNYQQFLGQSDIELFFRQNEELYEVLTNQYVEYIVDLAVNQQTVHWCGHSRHQLQTPYNTFDEDFRQYNTQYCDNLIENIKIPDFSTKLKIMNIFLQEQVEFLQSKNVKPLTLKVIVSGFNENYLNSQIVGQNQEIPMKIHFDFDFKDQNLRHFNQKAKICESIQENDKCFFSIPPLLSPEQILIKSIDTNDSDNISHSSSNSYQYISDTEDNSPFTQSLRQNQFSEALYVIQPLNIQQKQKQGSEERQALLEMVELQRAPQLNNSVDLEEKQQNQKQLQMDKESLGSMETPSTLTQQSHKDSIKFDEEKPAFTQSNHKKKKVLDLSLSRQKSQQ